ncbi:GTP pyrophosphokinase YwaC [Bacillus licheniformis]|jgi:putative GTP pyrophosphokinase|uniref:GTP-pyrophosphokinase YwaC n=5 Tax=Bacillus subtilis group TaxID=653685 RepID=Q65DH3_BACLD|nr:putative GTP-pyrophosphokinase YwaC [Bacillus licheniformis DSM 13 = ATCC 14580]AKQ75356.1 GTP-pyrophosphokinase YwaC [Bacillus licheniformis WX-02]AMR12402.1 GTP pyrophosphokinase [Bacillus licheniformis]APJ28907.1 GTP pyrophosphokinase [Bacillus sp. H15-1]ARA87668.1 GTP pyrophosphokinase [Bacillus paralicheniformis]ASV17368.1 GTP pyrophosphokinase [Bacillus sp. 1s-1]EFV70681.1 YwaC protein [Bacillus sp. BT1B_CT2]EQM25658.1 GTP pyrophosphokinase [Bacillus licheniformis CG-B52]MBY8348437
MDMAIDKMIGLPEAQIEDLRNLMEDWKNELLVYKFALDQMDTKFSIISQEYNLIHGHNPIEHTKSRVKSFESLINKLVRKGCDITTKAAKEHINDIAGLRIVCSFLSDIYNMVEVLKEHEDIKILKMKDYIKNPKPNGYRSLHLIVEVPVYLTNRVEHAKVEIQIRTIAMDFWASLEHKIYYKLNNEVPNQLTDELKEAADIANYLDEKMLHIRTKADQ